MSSRSLPLLATLPFLLAPALGAAGLTPRLVKDINLLTLSQGSLPSDYVTVGNLVFFAADDGETGKELWRTDGTAGGTYRLTDACPGQCPSGPARFAVSDRQYFFTASDESLRRNLWVSGGTPATTFELTSAAIPPLTGNRRLWVPALGLLLFTADDGVHGPELWRSDGSPGGTYQVTDLWPGSQGSDPRAMVLFKDRVYFVADDPQKGPILWKSDGTPQGTQAVRDPVPGTANHPVPALLRVAGNTLYFVAPTPSQGVELWKSDGTTRGTVPLTDLVPGPGSPAIWDLIALGNRLLFVADDGKSGQELWATDGTQPGTKMLTHLTPADAFHGQGGDYYLSPTILGNRLLFGVDDGDHGGEIWTTDGTPAGTSLLKDVCPGRCTGAGAVWSVVGKYALFPGYNSVRGQEMWVTDGTTAGTHLLRDICRGSCSSYPFLPFTTGSQAFFVTSDPFSPSNLTQRLWRTDGTSRGTFQVATARSLQGSGGAGFGGAVLGNTLIFSAQDDAHGDELWRSDGTPQGTGLLVDINSHNPTASSVPYYLSAAGNDVFFFANDGQHGFELWKSDGTAAGTALVHEFIPGLEPGFMPFSFLAAQAGGSLFFKLVESGGDTGADGLWRTDGTDRGTVRLTNDKVWPGQICAVGNTLFFAARDDDHGTELWKSDGTPAGTVLVKDVEPGFAGSEVDNLTAFQGRLYFTARMAGHGNELWVSDGTEAGTHMVKDIAPGDGSSSPAGLLVVAGRLWFIAAPDEFHPQIWSTDGTEAGTVQAHLVPDSDGYALVTDGTRLLIHNFISSGGGALWLSDGTAAGTRSLGAIPLNPSRLGNQPVTFGGKLYFTAGTADRPFDPMLWASDGTPEGTAPVPGPNGLILLNPTYLQVFAGRLVFTTPDGGLWQSDGTSAGTVKIRDLAGPGESGIGAWELVPAGSRLFFRSFDRATGEELWTIDGP
ncbi:MAG: hypothetical protein DMF53_05930 [Acidobacteria bacterium]|nr:MAG: hypothetical protein DMF53_05930 [Acidobacteriota bacterium]